jgi:nucleotide-binding universal stress UspA family protein
VAVTPFAIAICGTYLAGQLEAEALRHVDEAERTVPADVPVTKLMAHGNAAKALLALADTGRWDLVMVGHRPARDRWPFRHGTGDALLHRSPVPVLVVRSAPEATAVRDQPGLERLRLAVGK